MNRGGILLLMSMFCVSTLLPARQSGTAPSAKAADAAGSPSGGALATKLKEYRDEGQGSLEKEISRALSDSLADPPEDPALSICQILGKHSGGEISQLIALLPDPVHTHLGLTFDRGIEVIQQAFQDEGYVYLTAVMPWDAHNHPEADDIEKRLTADAYHKGREPHPGLLIFRRADARPGDPNRIYLVWVVGESPTRGVNVGQFQRAADWIHPAPGEPLRILGPTFSGSLVPLDQLLDKRHGPRNLVFSGTVSSGSEIHNFETQSHNTLVSFQESDENLIAGFLQFVAKDKWQVAILSEDETAYGGPLAHADREVLTLHFPREISQLRAAYQSDDSAPASPRSEREPPRAPLPFNLEVSGSDDDTVPPFSHHQTPLSQEAVLLGIVSRLREHEIRYVLLRATDPLDTLFLSQYLAAAYPRARIVSLNADMLAGRGVDAAAQLHGTMALSSYPPASARQTSGPSERILPSSLERGTYDALRSLLETETTVPLPKGQRLVFHLQDYPNGNGVQRLSAPIACVTGTPDCPQPPQAFLMALGHDEYWLTDSLPLTQGTTSRSVVALPPPHASEAYASNAPPAWRVLELIAASLAVLFICWILNASIRSPFQAVAQLAPANADARRHLVVLMGILLVVLLTIVLWPVLPTTARWLMLPAHGRADNLTASLTVTILWLLVGALLASLLLWLTASRGALAAPNQSGRPDPYVIRCSTKAGAWEPIARWLLRHAKGRSATRQRVICRLSSKAGDPASSIWQALSHWLLRYAQATSPVRKAAIRWLRGTVEVIEHCHVVSPDQRQTHLSVPGLSLFLLAGGIPFLLCLRAGLFTLSSHALVTAKRWLQLDSGLSPVLPMTFLIAMGLWWSYHIIAGCALSDERRPRIPVGIARSRWAPLGELPAKPSTPKTLEPPGRDCTDLVQLLTPRPASWSHYAFYTLAGVLTMIILQLHGNLQIMTIEGQFIGRVVFPGAIAVATAAILGTCGKLLLVWVATRRFLVSLEASPLEKAFRRLDGHSWTELWRLSDVFLQVFLRIGAKTREALVSAANSWPQLKTKQQEVFEVLARTRELFGVAAKSRCKKCDLEVVTVFAEYQLKMAEAAGEAFNHLADAWEREKEEWDNPRLRPSPETLQDRACERFVCMVYVNFIAVILWRIRTLTLAVCGMFIFFSLAIMSYPFQPRSTFGGLLLLLFLCVVGTVTVVLAQLHRDVTLSLLTNTEPGKLGADFWTRTASFVALPILSLAISRFPQIGLFVGSWLQPALRALQK